MISDLFLIPLMLSCTVFGVLLGHIEATLTVNFRLRIRLFIRGLFTPCQLKPRVIIYYLIMYIVAIVILKSVLHLHIFNILFLAFSFVIIYEYVFYGKIVPNKKTVIGKFPSATFIERLSINILIGIMVYFIIMSFNYFSKNNLSSSGYYFSIFSLSAAVLFQYTQDIKNREK